MIRKINTTDGERLAIVFDKSGTIEDVVRFQKTIVSTLSILNPHIDVTNDLCDLMQLLQLFMFDYPNVQKLGEEWAVTIPHLE